ncbi:hypothetical protein BaRGS_00037063 [Batillaria attramentaria]|uniref:Uncharacterized protein n=1 Tax=Batillaria attramentaria TaxID=370345 RepID=A0ABD0J9R7_9CAEN
MLCFEWIAENGDTFFCCFVFYACDARDVPMSQFTPGRVPNGPDVIRIDVTITIVHASLPSLYLIPRGGAISPKGKELPIGSECSKSFLTICGTSGWC